MPLLGIIAFFLLVIWRIIASIQHKKTDYFAQTKRTLWDVYCNTGTKGEYLLWKQLQQVPGYGKCLCNCYIPKPNGGMTEVDLLFLHESGIYVFESKNLGGWIFGNSHDRYWTQVLPNGRGRSKKNPFYNPIWQNQGHLKWLSNYLHISGFNFVPEGLFHSYIVFSDRCTFKKLTLNDCTDHVLHRRNVLAQLNIDLLQNNKLTPAQIDKLYACLSPLLDPDHAKEQIHLNAMQTEHRDGYRY